MMGAYCAIKMLLGLEDRKEIIETTKVCESVAANVAGRVVIDSPLMINGWGVEIDGLKLTGLQKCVLTLGLDCPATLELTQIVWPNKPTT